MHHYIQTVNSGKGFITAQDRMSFSISGYDPNIWVVEDNRPGKVWVEEKVLFNEGKILTKSEAQALVDTAFENSKNEKETIPMEKPILP
tara:strand:- start:613 stop:879 length:267 start_codon:yes stop_codon:yes gene_type:complete